jgi:hypothetical protein
VLCITGNGLKTREVLEGTYHVHDAIQPTLSDVVGLMDSLKNSSNQKVEEAAWA